MNTYEVLRNRTVIGTVKAVSVRQAMQTARRHYGRCEVIGTIAKPELTAQYADYGRTEGRAPCNNTAEGKARIAAIREAEIAKWKAAQS